MPVAARTADLVRDRPADVRVVGQWGRVGHTHTPAVPLRHAVPGKCHHHPHTGCEEHPRHWLAQQKGWALVFTTAAVTAALVLAGVFACLRWAGVGLTPEQKKLYSDDQDQPMQQL